MEARGKDYIAEQAIDFQNRHFFGFKAAIHLEDAEDEMFWDALLQNVKPGKYDFIYYSKSKSGNDTRGCEQCLRFKDYLNEKFFICIDSDLRHLLAQEDISAKNFIAQTYTYSWENHYCFADRLQNRFVSICPDVACKFDFRVFLSGYSKAVYEPFMFMLYLKRAGACGRFEREFNIRLPKQCSSSCLENNGEKFILALNDSLTDLCVQHPLWSSFDQQDEKSNITHTLLTSSNAYLYVRGHNVLDLVLNIGKFLCYGTGVSFKDDILLSLLDDGAEELNLVRKDLECILV